MRSLSYTEKSTERRVTWSLKKKRNIELEPHCGSILVQKAMEQIRGVATQMKESKLSPKRKKKKFYGFENQRGKKHK